VTLDDDETRIVQIACDYLPLRYKDETLEDWEQRFIAYCHGPYNDLCAMLLKAENKARNNDTD